MDALYLIVILILLGAIALFLINQGAIFKIKGTETKPSIFTPAKESTETPPSPPEESAPSIFTPSKETATQPPAPPA